MGGGGVKGWEEKRGCGETGEELKGAVPSVEEYLLPVNWGKLARLCAW